MKTGIYLSYIGLGANLLHLSYCLQIAKKHLLPKSIKSHGLKKNEIKVEDESISKLIESYTREAGVRNLERQISNVCRKTAKDIATKVKKKVVVTPEVVHDYLGPVVFFSDVAERADSMDEAKAIAAKEQAEKDLADNKDNVDFAKAASQLAEAAARLKTIQNFVKRFSIG